METEVSQSLWADLTSTFDNPQMMHAVLVHTPIMFAVIGLLLALCSVIFHKNSLYAKGAFLFFVLLALSSWLTSESGEKAEELIPNTLPAAYWDAINNHGAMAEKIWMFALAASLLSLAAFHKNPKIKWSAKGLMVLTALVANGWVAVTGHYGGELVYKYGIGTPALVVETHQAKSENVSSPVSNGDSTAVEVRTEPIVFAKDIKPIFDTYCTSCHNPSDSKGGLDMTVTEAFIRGGKKAGPPIIPGQPDLSPLYQFINGHLQPQMPKEEKPLSKEEISLIAHWIEDGALFDDQTSYADIESATTDHSMNEWITKLMQLKDGTETPKIKTDIRYKHLAKVAPTSISQKSATARFSITDYTTLKRYRHSIRMQPLAPVEPPPLQFDDHPIDAFMTRWWTTNSVDADWDLCDDSTFVRRLYLDLIGLYPTPEQHAAFVEDATPNKRAALIDELLSQDEAYAANWLPYWEDALCSNPETPLKFDWHGDSETYLYDFMKENKPLDQLVIDLMDLSSPTNIPTWIIRADNTTIGQSVANAAQVFMGESIRCSQCHNHFENRKNTQPSFLGFASMFAVEDIEMIRCETATGQHIPPTFMYDLPDFDVSLDTDTNLFKKTQIAARMISDPTNPRFATTFMNRLWKKYIGLGLYEPMEDFRLDVEASVPALLDWMADDFIIHGYDIKHSIRQILTSKVYQQKYDPKKADVFNEGTPEVPRFFQSPQLRRLSGEQFLDNLKFMLGYPFETTERTCFNNAPDALARALAIPATRNETITARDQSPTLFTSLEFMNGKKFSEYIQNSPALRIHLNALIDGTPYDEIMNTVYHSLFNRTATATEQRLGFEYANSLQQDGNATSKFPVLLFTDLYWVLFSSPEFLYVP
jgi:uncharacterized membrane protein